MLFFLVLGLGSKVGDGSFNIDHSKLHGFGTGKLITIVARSAIIKTNTDISVIKRTSMPYLYKSDYSGPRLRPVSDSLQLLPMPAVLLRCIFSHFTINLFLCFLSNSICNPGGIP